MMGHFSNLNKENKELKIYRPFGPSIGHCKLPQELINDFKSICSYADIDSEYALTKFAKAMKLDIYNLSDIQSNVIQNKPPRTHKLTNKFRLTFND